MKQVKWFDRKFSFGQSENTFPSIMERLSGTPIRLEEKVSELTDEALVYSEDSTWSIKENIGHLTDLEPLWQGRLNDILGNKGELREADLENSITHQANHNAQPVTELLAAFRRVRQETTAMLADLEDDAILKSAIHPRLKIPMRTIDLFLFVAEHDDHHLARISALINKLKTTN
ncbi:MAG: DinB family protein [Flavobacterium sp.]|nr:MAG: DinB family protein [Flavobacterium sp.]